MSIYSVTKNEMLKGDVKCINENIAGGFLPLECYPTDLGRPFGDTQEN